MILSFKSKPLQQFWQTGSSARIDARLYARLKRRLDALNVAMQPSDMNVPGFNFHALQGLIPVRYTVHINGPWCITFAFEGGDAIEVDLEQYH